jgi:hypothetical protein
VAAAVAGDVIMIKGSFSEAVIVAKAGLSIIGAGTGPNRAVWTAAADAVCLTINALTCWSRTSSSGRRLFIRRGTCAILLDGAGYARSRMPLPGKTGSQAAIYSPVCNSDNVEISDSSSST